MGDIQIHIWELSEKTDGINKDEDLIMVHDNMSLKKIHINKLFEYFRQDQKIENTIAFFENKLNKLDEKYNIYYSSLSIDIDKYDEVLEDLINKFSDDQNRIRLIETSTNQLINNSSEIRTDFETILKKYDILSETLSNFGKVLDTLIISINTNKSALNNLNIQINDMNNKYIDIDNNTNMINKKIESIKDTIKKQTDFKKDELITIIESKYNKVLSIIDYYHHIHE